MALIMEKILIVEDFGEMRNNLIDILENKGYKTYSAENGTIGLKLAKKTLPNLILSDIMMPEMGGIKLLYEIKNNKLTESIPFIFISARTTIEDVKFGLRLGADGYITKPFTISTLITTVSKAISQNKLIEKVKL